MILVTGGAGFIGSHTVRALHELGEEVVLFQRRTPKVPSQLADLPVHVVQGDVADLDRLLEVGRAYPITGIVHLAVALPWPATDDPVGDTGRAVDAFLDIVRAAQAWGVERVVTASTIGVYGGIPAEGALTEDLPLSMRNLHVIPTFKKVTELVAGYLGDVTGVELVNARISGTWGPGGHLPDPFFPASVLARAAATGTAPDLSGIMAPPRAEDSLDLCYVKDTGRALALLAVTPDLRHRTYNVGSGRPTSNADVLAALASVEPGFRYELPSAGPLPTSWLDIARLRDDTGFEPAYDTAAAAADYVAWFRAGHDARDHPSDAVRPAGANLHDVR